MPADLLNDISYLWKLSLWWEARTGYDSIKTIKKSYGQDGIYACVWPGCGYRRHDPAAMWKHVHFKGNHGRKPVILLSELAAQYDEDGDGAS